MATKPVRCLRCNGPMEPGFIADRGDYESARQATWASGAPEPSFWRQTDVARDARKLRITTYRCERCGYLESYATETVSG